MVIITPQGIKKKYTIVFTEKATSVQWAYFHKLKNGVYNALVKYQKIIKTQFRKVIKKWCINGVKNIA